MSAQIIPFPKRASSPPALPAELLEKLELVAKLALAAREGRRHG